VWIFTEPAGDNRARSYDDAVGFHYQVSDLMAEPPLPEFPSVSCTYVVRSDDQLVGPEWSKRIARDRLGADLIELPGSHSPLLSRPSALADVLLRTAE
jgi:hypothetical protein